MAIAFVSGQNWNTSPTGLTSFPYAIHPGDCVVLHVTNRNVVSVEDDGGNTYTVVVRNTLGQGIAFFVTLATHSATMLTLNTTPTVLLAATYAGVDSIGPYTGLNAGQSGVNVDRTPINVTLGSADNVAVWTVTYQTGAHQMLSVTNGIFRLLDNYGVTRSRLFDWTGATQFTAEAVFDVSFANWSTGYIELVPTPPAPPPPEEPTFGVVAATLTLLNN